MGENVVEEVKHRGLDVTSINSYSYVLICRIFDELCERAADVIIDSLKNPTIADDSKVHKVLEELEKSKTKLAELSLF